VYQEWGKMIEFVDPPDRAMVPLYGENQTEIEE
jgi:hypothetical protein